jgi:hypothetical protein
MWVVVPEVEIATSTNGLPVHFRDQFWTPLHSQNFQEWNCAIRLNFHREFGGGPNAAEMEKKLL